MENEFSQHKLLIGGVLVGGALLIVLLMSRKSAGTSAQTTDSSGMLTSQYNTAQTVYVPTTSETYNYETNNGTIVHADSPTGQPTTIYMPNSTNSSVTTNATNSAVNSPSSPITSVPNVSTLVTAPTVELPPPIITATAPTPAPAPKPATAPVPVAKAPTPAPAPAPKPAPAPAPVVYKAYGTDSANSSLWGLSQMYLQNHTGNSHPTNAQIQAEVNKVASLNNIKNPNVISKGQSIKMA